MIMEVIYSLKYASNTVTEYFKKRIESLGLNWFI